MMYFVQHQNLKLVPASRRLYTGQAGWN